MNVFSLFAETFRCVPRVETTVPTKTREIVVGEKVALSRRKAEMEGKRQVYLHICLDTINSIPIALGDSLASCFAEWCEGVCLLLAVTQYVNRSRLLHRLVW